MEIDISDIAGSFNALRQKRSSRHAVSDRIRPSFFQYDYLALSALVADVARLIAEVPARGDGARRTALDLGCGRSPYRELIEPRGFVLKTFDIDTQSGADFVGAIEATGLPDAFADLVVCTQVLEHSLEPGRGLGEMFRILRPGGHLIASAPHIWFYHPHPSDNWRFTQEGLMRLVGAAGFEPLKLLSQGGSGLSYFQIKNFLLYGIAGKLGAPAYAINNMLGKLSDRLFRNNLFCLNFALLARKPTAA